jgi:hypothetical protein
MQHTNKVSPLWFESELTARYQADLSGAHARAYLREVREREDLSSQTSLDQQIDYLLEQWRYSLLDVALAKQSSIPPLDLLKALVVIEAYDQAIALTEQGLESLSTSREDVFFDLGIFCLDQDPDHPKASLFFQHAFQCFTQHKQDDPIGALSFAKRLVERKRRNEAEQFFEIAFETWELDRGNNFSIIESELIWMLTQLDFWDKAEAIIAAHPNDAYLLAGFGIALRNAGQIERGDTLLAQVHSLMKAGNGGQASRFIYFYAEYQAWQAAIDLLPFILEDNRFSVIQTILLDALKMQAWQIAEQLCDLITVEYHRESFLTRLVERLVQNQHYQEAERVARRLSDPYYQDDAFVHIIQAYASVQRWSEARAIFQSLPNLEEYPASLRSYLEMCIQEDALAEASYLLEKVSQAENRLIVQAQLALAYQKHDPSYKAGSVLVDIEQQALQIDDEYEQQLVLHALVKAYAALKQWSEALGVLAQTKQVTTYTYSFEREIYTSLLEALIADDEKDLAQECVALFSDQRMRHELRAYLILRLAQHGDRHLVEHLSKVLLIEQRRQYAQDWQHKLERSIKDALTGKYGLSDAAWIAYRRAQTRNPKPRTLAITRGQTPKQSFDIAIARQQWRKAECIIQQFQPAYRAELYIKLAWELLPSKRWNELIRITRFVQNEPSMQMWHRLEAFERLIRALVKAGRWRQALRLISTLETADMQRYDEPALQPNLIIALIDGLVEQSLFKQALSVYSEISDPECKVRSCLSIANGLSKANKWQQAERLLQDISGDMLFEYGYLATGKLNELLLRCYQSQRMNSLDLLCEWTDRLISRLGIHKQYFTTLCLIGRSEHAEKLARRYSYASEQDAALSFMVEGLLKLKDFDKAEQLVLEMTTESLISRSYERIARYYLSNNERDRLIRFADRVIRQADSFDKIKVCQPLIMILIALRPKQAQALVDLLKQELALEQRLLQAE